MFTDPHKDIERLEKELYSGEHVYKPLAFFLGFCLFISLIVYGIVTISS